MKTISDAIAVNLNAVIAPNRNHINPVNELASIVQMFCRPENVPMAVAVSSFSVIFEIQALAIPSVAAA